MTGIALSAAIVAGIWLGSSGALAAVLLLFVLRLAGRVSRGWAVIVAIGALLGVWRSAPPPDLTSPPWIDNVAALRGTVASGPLTTNRGQRFDFEIAEIRTGSTWAQESGLVCVSAPGVPSVSRADRLFLAVSAENFSDLPPSIASAFAARGCVAAASAWTVTVLDGGGGPTARLDRLRQTIAGRLQSASPGDSGALMAGLVTGDDGGLSHDRRDAFIATGTTHITAVSGSNFSIIVVTIAALGSLTGLRRRIGWLVGVVAIIWLYALLVGLAPPAFRAALVATGVLFAAKVGRRPDLVTLIFLAGAIELLVRPGDLWTLSFRLSFASSLALALVVPGRRFVGVGGMVRGATIVAVAAQLAATPLLLATFGRLSWVSLPANLAIAPFVAVAFPLAFFAAAVGIVSETAGQVFAYPGSIFAGLIIGIVDGGAAIGPRSTHVGNQTRIGQVVVAGMAWAFVAAMSIECRRAIRRFWPAVIQANPVVLVAGVATVVGLIGGCGMGMAFR